MRRLIDNIINGSWFSSIEHAGDQNSEHLHVLSTKLGKKGLDIIVKEELKNIDSVKKILDKKGKVHLIINNHHIIEKTIAETNESVQVMVRSTFSNININDFYYEVKAYKGSTTIFLCRKDYVDELVNSYSNISVIITSWSFGFLCVNEVLPYLKDIHHNIITSRHTLTLVDSKITDVVRTNPREEKIYTIGDEKISQTFLIPFGGVLRAFSNFDVSTTSNFQENIVQQNNSFKQHRFFQKGLPAALGILILVFLINFLMHNKYYKEVDRLEQVSQINESQRRALLIKDSIVAQKEKRFEDVIASASSSVSLYIDSLMLALPESIVLGEVSFQPIVRKIKERKEIQFENDVVRIFGVTNQVSDISKWITYVENLDFVSSALLEMEPENGNVEFEIKVKLLKK